MTVLACGPRPGPAPDADQEAGSPAATAATTAAAPAPATTPATPAGPPLAGTPPDTTRTVAAPAPRRPPEPPARTARQGGGWTTVAVERTRVGAPALLRAVRTSSLAGFDRVAFDFDVRLPGYRVELAHPPVSACGTGDPVELPGAAVLVVAFRGAAAHDDLGNATVADRDRRPGLPALAALKLFCDFEGDVSWALALPRPTRFRVSESAAPPRLTVDIEHPR